MQLGHRLRCIGQAYRAKQAERCTTASRRRFVASSRLGLNEVENVLASKTRNIGIIAHIDAGKTTTTERMLYYSGHTRRIGDVDDGSTVTDFLPAERARGITIQSAAITFHWPPQTGDIRDGLSDQNCHTINLIDTPGHADFTFEVLRSLRILDGAICILDGVAGVEAQTEKVWHQARTYRIPKVLFVNKLDRDGAAFGKTVKEIAAKLHAWPAVCQIPWFENGNDRFQGVVDIIQQRALQWPHGGDGKSIKTYNIDELRPIDPKLADEAHKARIALVELLSGHDDIMVEDFLDCDQDHLAITPAAIMSSLRRCLLDPASTIVPVFAGASFRNIGVQPLLDIVTELLPNPNEAPEPEIKAGNFSGSLQDLIDGKLLPAAKSVGSKKQLSKKNPAALVQNLEACALAFKVVNDLKRGILVYVRVYHGSINRGAMIFNTNLQTSERMPRLLKMYASDAVETASIPAGQIGVITGLKHARTGDTLISYTGANPKNGPPAPLNDLQLRPIHVPPPVFFASIEPQSLSEEKPVAEALSILLREDPSLHLSTDEDSGQTLLSGMGELHLEIAGDRLIKDMKAKATMGKIEIAYRECVTTSAGPETVIYDREASGKSGKASCTASVDMITEESEADAEADLDLDSSSIPTLSRDGNIISILITRPADADVETPPLPPGLTVEKLTQSLHNGALAALARGPTNSFPVHSTRVHLSIDPTTHFFGSDTTPAALSSAARLAVTAALKKSAKAKPTAVMEPLMNVIISVDEQSLGAVVHDLSGSRGGQIMSLTDDAEDNSSSSSTSNPSGGVSSSGEEITLIDTRKVYAPPDPFDAPTVAGAEEMALQGGNRQRSITARVPLKEMVGYLKVLRSHTGGRGTFVMSVDRFERMGGQREKVLLKELRGL